MSAPTKNARAAIVKKKILIVDDHPMMREGLVQLIGHEKDLEICGEAGAACQALANITAAKPDLVLTDISLPDKSGLELIKDVKAQLPDALVLVISMHDEALYTERVLRAGGRGYIMKQEGGKKIVEAIRRVLDGKIYVSEKMSAKILELFSGGKTDPATSPIEKLTDREFEVFQLIGKGLTTVQVAAHLHVSPKTVEVHRANIKNKLQIAKAPELLRYAVRWLDSQSAT